MSWTTAVLFWSTLWASVAFDDRFPWIRTVWVAVLWFTLLAFSIYYVFHIRRHENGALGLNGYPRWYLRFFFDE